MTKIARRWLRSHDIWPEKAIDWAHQGPGRVGDAARQGGHLPGFDGGEDESRAVDEADFRQEG
jgi:hypothetical protein